MELRPQSAVPPGSGDRVAIVGGGAAGAFLALQLAARGIASTVLDRNGAFARGVAYSAPAPWHRLNVPIDKMGGVGADEDDRGFLDWYVANRRPVSDRAADRYVPRADYGAWLRSELDAGVASGLVALRTDEVVALAERPGGVALGLAGGAAVAAPAAVLCLGNQPPRALRVAVPAARLVADMWAPGAMHPIAPDEAVLIVGTGSTGIDALLELHHRGHRGPITMLSRRGLMPLEDAPPAPYTVEHRFSAEPTRLLDVLRLLRAESDDAVARGRTWQSVVDAFRAQIPRLWEGLPEAGRRHYMRHLRAYWLIHRHRLAPDIAELLRTLRREGRVEIVTGRLRTVREQGGALSADIERRGGGTLSLPVGWVINCTGPQDDFRRLDDPLVRHLLAEGLARAGSFGIGLDVDADSRLQRSDGTPHARLFALGNATWTRFGEVTSAPQIRRRAVQLGELLARDLAQARPPR